MIMVAKKKNVKNEKGQALLEFVLIVPILIIFVWYLVQINVVVNASVVGQQHARSQLFVKMHNHRAGPTLSARKELPERAVYYIGVAADTVRVDDRDGPQGVEAPVFGIGLGANPERMKTFPGARDDKGEAEAGWLRQKVRVRTAVGICTSPSVLKADGTKTSICGE